MSADRRKALPHPMQPVANDGHGVWRFKQNEIIRYLCDTGKLNLNEIAMMRFTAEDRMQLAQLLGYSLGGYGELSYVTDESYDAAHASIREEDK